MLNGKRSMPLKPTPPPFRNHGNYVVSVAELNRWLGEKAEEAGAYVLSETVGAKLLVEDGAVVGVRTGDKGRDKAGGEKANFEPGSDVIARATVLAEGCWGHLTGAALKGLGLAREGPAGVGARRQGGVGGRAAAGPRDPHARLAAALAAQVQGVRRLLDLPMNREGEPPRVSLGFVVGLDYADARLSVHDVLQEFKLHPLVRGILGDGKRVAWGAKAIPEGGYWAMPRLHAPGMVICGDAGGMVNVPRLKGIHYAIRSGMLAAETIYARLKAGSNDFSAYDDGRARVRDRQGPVRVAQHEAAVRQGLLHRRRDLQRDGRDARAGCRAATGRRTATPSSRWSSRTGTRRYPKPDGKYTFDKLSGVFLTGNATRDDAPSHIRIQQRVPRELAEAWAWMCPAAVYEVPEDVPEDATHVDLIVNPSNCVQCGAITAKGGRLTPPEGGDGPVYQVT